MPSKRKRVASRQAQLSRRKRRDRTRGPSHEIAPSPAAAPESDSSGSSVTTAGVSAAQGRTSAVIERPALPAQEKTRRNRPSRVRTEPLPSYAYLKTELRRIGIIASVVVVLLAIFTVVLK